MHETNKKFEFGLVRSNSTAIIIKLLVESFFNKLIYVENLSFQEFQRMEMQTYLFFIKDTL